ncbi:hypothetical protein AB0E64_02075 [Streptomyces caelestis]|uniref:Uncharacterized protein n=1 Tax=Streptomyces caelestis TaxID=36816 RepID=A0A7W9HAF3_9ACTN|nr:hypothetical protein [Streptomyces caelestis]MBB5798632.1 hypothetical protein [Streptomyces caelestis]GGW51687.1 hypothetical protein GCM10010320_35670 [Streptomyces caelestis]
MDYNLSGLSTREFEHVSQALAQEILGPGVSAFGDGKDGGREATFEGRVPYPSELEAWDGYGVVQAKFRQRTDQQPQDAVSWLKGQVKEEFEAWLSPTSKRERLPEYLIFTTNVILTPVRGSGGIAQIEQFVSTYAARLGLKGWAVWHHDQLCRYLDRYDSIRRTYAGAITSGDVLAQLLDAVSAGHKPRSDALTDAARASQHRREARLSLVPEERADAVLDWADKSSLPVVTVPAGTLAVLVAPMGAGKSEEAESWLREGLREAAGDPDVVIPVWVDAGKAVPDLLDAIPRAGGEPASGLGRIVIDDLDGISPEQVAQLLYEPRLLLAAHPTARILATCRPGIELGRAVVHEVAPWSVRRGAELLDLVVGSDARMLFEEREVQDLLTSPLQALSVASRLLAGEDARVSSLELLSGLAASVIKGRRKGSPTSQTWDRLARLAVHILNAGGSVPAQHFGHEAEVWELTDTGLVVQEAAGLRFALPVFEQHFGAQALRKGSVLPEEIVTADAFPRWRYAIAFAVSASAPDEAENLMLRLARANPAAASWTFDEIARGKKQHHGMREAEDTARTTIARLVRADHDELRTAETAGTWLREALEALVEGFGPLSGSLVEMRDGRLPRWGVWAKEGWVAISPSRYSSEPPAVTPLASHPSNREDLEWRWWSQHLFLGEPLGRWGWARGRIREPLERVVRRGALLVPPDSPLAHERLWHLAQRLRQGNVPRDGVSVPEVRRRVEAMMERVRTSVRYTHQVAGYTYDTADIRWLHSQLAGVIDEVLRRPYGEPDQEIPRRGRMWQGYSPLLTLRITRQILRDALIGYRQLVELNFPSLAPALGLYSVLPVSAEGMVVMPEDDTDGSHSGLIHTLRPKAAGRRNDPPEVDLDLWTEPGFGPTSVPRWSGRCQDEFPSAVLRRSRAVHGSSRPATELAYEWLVRDLKAVGWLGVNVQLSV